MNKTPKQQYDDSLDMLHTLYDDSLQTPEYKNDVDWKWMLDKTYENLAKARKALRPSL